MDVGTIATEFGKAETFLKAVATLFGETPKVLQGFFVLSGGSSE